MRGHPGMLAMLGVRDLTQPRHSVLRNYPLWGHLRFLLEFIRPEIRQYFVEDDTDERPSRAQRSIVYQRAKGEVDSRPFGTELDVKIAGYEWIGHSLAPTRIASSDFRVLVGEGRAKPYSMSVFNISAMSFGAVGQRHPRAEPRREAGRLHPRYGRGLDLAVPPGRGRRPDLGDRFRLFRLP